MTRLESGGSDRTMEAGFRENSVYSAYIHSMWITLLHPPTFRTRYSFR
jgi:hypothetical protein